ncbi:MAG: outer membrane protein OmpA-like peptidoglycan-associated protein [Crocinitomicaceae bacterium]|jgi:outer membrane protein OmpA-like peptidoglycan-associated protein
MKTIKRLALCAAVALSFSSFSQNYLGIHSSNYGGVMATDLNPASFVDGRFKVDINLASANIGFWTNAGYFDSGDMPKWWVKSFKNDEDSQGSIGTVAGGTNPHNDWILPDSTFADRYIFRNYDSLSTSKTVGIYNNVQIDVLNFMFHINPKIAVGFAAKFRSVTNVDDIDPKLAVLAENDLDITSLWNQTFNESLLNLNHMTWMEYGFVYSQVLKDDGEHFMKAGGKAKWLSGIAAAYAYTDNFEYNLFNDDTSQYLKGDMAYGYSNNIDTYIDGTNTGGFPESASKFGLGLDLGFVYEWRPEWKDYKYDMDGETNIWRRDKEKYKIRVGASILDIGGMKFEKGAITSDFGVNTDQLFDLTIFDNADNFADFDSIIDSLTVNNPDWTASSDNSKTFFMATPSAFSFQFDYHIWKYFYLNTTGVFSLQNRKNPHRVRVANQISVTPSFDHSWFGVHMPFSYNKYSKFKAGLGLRLGPLTLGVTDFRTLFASGKIKGAEIYTGLRLPILYVHPSDIDGDLVSDKLDECLVVPGVWEFKGCPDTDRDGIKDLDDLCPNTPGVAEFQGCPDSDGDGLPDKDDDCPDEAGPIAFKGCPDRDNDSIIDKNDDCPDVPGLQAFKGCPDTDGDGIKDEDDACPDVPGPVVNNGCPDTDGDGLFDFIDECPTDFGPKENNGCPWPDTDEDGLLDKDDKCPYIAGPLSNEGCPYQDTDEDGVLDKDDECPTTPGPVANKGCPEIEAAIEEILKTAFENLEFETSRDVIKDVSLPSLGELADVLVKKPEWRLQISGHTDNVGAAQGNLVLSKKRAESVKRFMVSKGIDADRLSVLYFGETDPVEDNSTPEGRQRNRRVEMVIIFK